MNQSILYPAMAMLLLNLVVATALFIRRIRAVQQGLNPAYFRFNRGARIPTSLITAEQHYQNVHEMPLVFFITVLLAYLAVDVNFLFLVLAWLYVAFRLIHSLIHLGSNHLPWRRNLFVASFIVLVLMWSGLLLQMVQDSR